MYTGNYTQDCHDKSHVQQEVEDSYSTINKNNNVVFISIIR